MNQTCRLLQPTLGFMALALLGGCLSSNSATQASLRLDYPPERRARWEEKHREYVARAQAGGVDVLFLGDSITEYWRDRGRAVWDREFTAFRAANFGLSGDRTQNVLWRITHGELDGISPRVVVLMIGTNNLGPGFGRDGITISKDSVTPENTPAQIVKGVQRIVHELCARLPNAKILLFGVLPRGESPTDPLRLKVQKINQGLARLVSSQVVFLNMAADFLAANGTLPREIMPDLVHPNERGYEIWASALRTPLRRALYPATP